MARTVADVALLLEVIAGKDLLDPRQYEVSVQPYTQAVFGKSIRGLRLGVVHEGFATPVSEPDVDAKVREAIKALREVSVRKYRKYRFPCPS